MSTPRQMRKLHRIGAAVAALPILIVVVSGLFLQVKKQFAWIQPPTVGSAGGDLALGFAETLAIAKGIPELEITSWDDVDRIDVRPSKGLLKVRSTNRWEVQLDGATGDVLQIAYRRSDFFEELHDGSWFHNNVKLYLFLPAALILFVLWLTGVYLFLLPYSVKRQKAKRLGARD
ncbi:MAG: PepSY-associated TM helix domain-containing protein [Planctomycetota bacterium]|nr:hypothetical protein [Planctomycetota bacterium]MDP6368153.1 PepSY-associated TM helix domain-containing protein [Planctomycetota bacterium]MDP6520678.1 PepSY-associated TM helix domain-containing protein [Planctomycetota bacterium]MDP6839863.1 PepSY-associated TM helix domain-containing protein [Planctomycetota bacterium]MDP6955997.1 PepSY-associated TM helix domain-containing protein [Planctomycetota bacterium]